MKTQYLTSLPPHWRPVASIFAALGDEIRQRILLLFEKGEELSIKDIASRFALSRTSVVHHLAVLEKANILTVRRVGKHALYTVQPDVILGALENLRLYIEQEYSTASNEQGENNHER